MRNLNYLDQVRVEFPDLANRTYLASCSSGARSKSVMNAVERYFQTWSEWGNPWEIWIEEVENTKTSFAKLISANPEEIAIGGSVSDLTNGLLTGMNYDGRSGIITTGLDFPTIDYIMIAQRKRGAEVVVIPPQDGQISISDYERVIDNNTKLVNIVHVSSLNGYKQDIKPICDLAHANGALTLVDAYQSIGSIPLDVKKLDIDFLVTGTLKYTLGMSGTALMYVKADLLSELEPFATGWLGQEEPASFGAEKLRYPKGASRFQTGTFAIPSAYASRAGIDLVSSHDLNVIHSRVTELTRYATDRCLSADLPLNSPKEDGCRGPLVSIKCGNAHDLELKLRKKGVLTSARGDGLRLSFHFYNSKSDVDVALDAIKPLLKD